MDGIEIFKIIVFSITFIMIAIGVILNTESADEEYRKWKQWRIDNPDDF
jgi:hypothetical protein